MCDNIPHSDYKAGLEELAPEILLQIFKYLSRSDLLNLKLTCRRICSVINSFWEEIVFGCVGRFLVTNQLHEIMQKRSGKIIRSFDKDRISNNWKNGRYLENNIFLYGKYTPCFQLDRDMFWLGRHSYIKAFKRGRHRIHMQKPIFHIKGIDSTNFCKFIVKNEDLAIGNGNHLKLYDIKKRNYTFEKSSEEMDIACIDMSADFIAVGNRNNKLLVYQRTEQTPTIKLEKLLEDRIWSVAIIDEKLAVGTAANCSQTSLFIFDVEKCQIKTEEGTNQRGAGILHLKWESPSLLWSSGYDSHLRKWDLRVGKCIQSFPDPWLSKIYCFECDFVNTVLTGCESNGRVVLWDVRKDKYVQMYYMSSCRRSSSPVYSLSFDAEHLFAVTESHLNILDFSTTSGPVQDYSKVFKVQIII